jgi:hypothetical protein
LFEKPIIPIQSLLSYRAQVKGWKKRTIGGRNIMTISESEDKKKDKGKLILRRGKEKEQIREYDPSKDESCVIIGGYSSYIRKKKIPKKTV